MARNAFFLTVAMLCALAGCGKKEQAPAPPEKPSAKVSAPEPAPQPAGETAATTHATPKAEDVQSAAQQAKQKAEKTIVEPAKELVKKAGEDPIGTAAEVAASDPKAAAEQVAAKAAETAQAAADRLKQDLQAAAEQKAKDEAQASGFAGALTAAAKTADAANEAKALDAACGQLAKDILALPPVTGAGQPPTIAFTGLADASNGKIDAAAATDKLRLLLTKNLGAKAAILGKEQSDAALARQKAGEADIGAAFILRGSVAAVEARPGVVRYELEIVEPASGKVLLTRSFDCTVSSPETEMLKKLPIGNVFGK